MTTMQDAPAASGTVVAAIVADALRGRPVERCAAREATRYAINGVQVSPVAGTDLVRIEATDGRRLLRVHVPGEADAPVVVPAAAFKAVTLKGGGKGVRRLMVTRSGWRAQVGATETGAAEGPIDCRWPESDGAFPNSKPRLTIALNARMLAELAAALSDPGGDLADVVQLEIRDESKPIVVRPLSAVDPRDVGLIMPVRGS